MMLDIFNYRSPSFLIGVSVFLFVCDIFFSYWANKIKSSVKLSVWQCLFYLALTAMMSIVIYQTDTADNYVAFNASFLMEYFLSIDNIFIFAMIVKTAKLNMNEAKKIVTIGVWLTVLLRFFFILFGVELVHSFEWVILFFAAYLFYSGILLLQKDQIVESGQGSVLIDFLKKRNLYSELQGVVVAKLPNGRFVVTNLFVALIYVVLTDFACTFDSIPAAFSMTNDFYIIYLSNIFAVFGLRSLYVVLVKFINKITYINKLIFLIFFATGIKIIVNYFLPHLIGTTANVVFIAIVVSSVAFCVIVDKAKKLFV